MDVDMDFPQFFMVYYESEPDVLIPWAEENGVGLLLNANYYHREGSGSFRNIYDMNADHHPAREDCNPLSVVDAGGFNILDGGHTSYPWSVEEYHQWLSENQDKFEWATVMDLACEERFDDQISLEERIDRTFENTLKHYELDPDYNILPILQGRTLHQYVEFYDRLKDHGIPTDYVGVGTVCRLSNTSKIVDIETGLREMTDVKHMHGFGVKINAFKRGAYFDTADSWAWCRYPWRGRECYLDESTGKLKERRYQTSRKGTIQSFKGYYRYVKDLQKTAQDRPGDAMEW